MEAGQIDVPKRRVGLPGLFATTLPCRSTALSRYSEERRLLAALALVAELKICNAFVSTELGRR